MSDKNQKRSWMRWVWLSLGFWMILAILFFGFILFKLPSVASLKNFRPIVASEVFSEDYVKIGEFFRERRSFRPLSKIPSHVIYAFVDAEDDQFFHHKGISFTGIFRAMVKNMLAGEVKQGGSTITQQVAKALLLSPERSLIRKAKEAVLAFKMESFLTKDQILEIYLNQVYLGHGAYGVEAAAETYFGKDLVDLSLGEIAMMAGLTKAPSRDNPRTNPDRARERQTYVLDRMKDEKHISKEELQAAVALPLQLVEETDLNRRYSPYFVEHVRRYVTEKYGETLVLEGGLQIYTTLSVRAAKASQKAVRHGIEEVDRHQGYRGPLENIPKSSRANFLQNLKDGIGEKPLKVGQNYKALVTQILDAEGLTYVSVGAKSGVIPIDTMKWARKPNPDRYWENDLIERPSQALKVGDVIWVRIPEVSSTKKSFPKDMLILSLSQEPIVQGSLVALDPKNGAIRAMVGGYDFAKSEFNRAVQARRQPGSSFKPILYSAALDQGYTAASMILDSPMVYDDPTTELRWKPKNFGGQFYGDTIFRDCLIESRNVPTIKIVQDIGLDRVIEYAQRMGIQSPLSRDLSLALGSSGVTPLELVSAYGAFPSGGRKIEPISIRKIVDRDGVVLERNALDDPALDLVEQAAVAQQRTLTSSAHQQAIETGKDSKAALPNGYVLSPQTAFVMTHLLKGVITFGTGSRAQGLGRPAAGKTGTTNDNHDAWFIGFTPNLLAGIWLGFDESTMTLGAREEGGRAASPIWLDFMKEALEGSPILDFQTPEGVVFAQIDPKTGKLATSKTKGAVFEAFREGTEPKETTEEAQTKKSPQQFFLQE